MVTDVIRIEDSVYNYVSNPEDHFTLTFNGEHVYTVGGTSLESLYGRLLICWMDGIHSFYVILKDTQIIQVDSLDYTLCKYLATKYHLIRSIPDIDILTAFIHL